MADIKVESEITGTVWKIETGVGDEVAEDDVIMILESMKMEIPVLAPESGRIKSFHIDEGANVSEGQHIVTLET
ncbi:acetyl-CoA carboxylase biotin carboxyl carrier protein subunit [Pikeienuella piscinae]|uniref:Acetyl-CoA carboxylase biotin carboxyl carrier protein subunit n=1 Tax=Pikeienuella piscinae TaxID=2748098 RepID=A0A7L5BUT3_9RHOB|nr:acetyl-CoA carboxylase biotin carboxyl carrier protein subunit [Pikeienuella piscinae]QIE55061.1 acetyl-CoA carboxylase biotin carboxyl carrier protein subunit [Pikeienuella piscinae]